MKPTMFLSIVLLLSTNGCLIEPAPPPPEPDDCTSPRALDGIESIEIGHMDGDAFVPWQDGQPVELTFGPQGGAMLAVVLSVSGRDLPECMLHTMQITLEFGPAAFTEHPVNTYEGPGGTRVTGPIWMIFDGEYPVHDDPMDLTLRIGDLALERTLVAYESFE
jgi:hypothetical protein